MPNEQNKVYDVPATFVNVKRVKLEQDDKKRDKMVFTFGLGEDKNGNPTNGCDQLIEALQQYKGKQVNLDFRVEEKEYKGKKFPSAFVRIVEMIPKDQQASQTAFVPKASKADQVKANAERLAKQFAD